MSEPGVRIVHLGTVIQTQFGVLDAAGDVLPQEPINVKLQVFSHEGFAEAFARLAEAREAAAREASTGE